MIKTLYKRDGRLIFDIIEHGLGDKISVIASPIARALGSPCIDKETQQLKPESGCAKMKARLNAGMSLYEAVKLRSQGK